MPNKIDSSLLIDSDLVAKVNFYVSDKIGEAVEFKLEFIDKVESFLLMIEKDEKEKSINEAYEKFLTRWLTLLSSDLMERY